MLYGVNQRLRVEDVDSPLCEVRPVKSVLLVVLTGDRGLCGGYNSFIIKRVSASCVRPSCVSKRGRRRTGREHEGRGMARSVGLCGTVGRPPVVVLVPVLVLAEVPAI